MQTSALACRPSHKSCPGVRTRDLPVLSRVHQPLSYSVDIIHASLFGTERCWRTDVPRNGTDECSTLYYSGLYVHTAGLRRGGRSRRPEVGAGPCRRRIGYPTSVQTRPTSVYPGPLSRRSQAPTGAYRCLQVPPGALRRPQAPSGAHRRPQAPSGAHRRPQAPTGAHRRPQAPAGACAHRRPQAPTGAHRRPQAPTAIGAHRRSQAPTGAPRRAQAPKIRSYTQYNFWCF